jgi:glycosyltransferase involved in cell wall biosynthesis
MDKKDQKYQGLSLSVFFPAYNEEANIQKTVEKAGAVLKNLSLKNYELIVINDGSKDQTGQMVEEMIKKDSHIRLVTHNPNKGYGEAVKSGYYNSRYPLIAFTDSDGQFDFSEITLLLDKIDKADVVTGYRMNRQDALMRKINGWGWTMLANLFLGINVRDVDCGFKLTKKKVIETIPHLESTRGGMINPEFFAKAKKAGFVITEVGVHHYARTAGKQTGANLKVILQSFADLFKLWWKIR